MGLHPQCMRQTHAWAVGVWVSAASGVCDGQSELSTLNLSLITHLALLSCPVTLSDSGPALDRPPGLVVAS